MFKRRLTKKVQIGDIEIGGNTPVKVQTMTTEVTSDLQAVKRQINGCIEAGAEIIRVSILNDKDAHAIDQIKKSFSIPVVADIHYSYKLAIMALENGADKIRINPGNLGGIDKLKRVTEKALKYNKPIRVGINAGSLEKEFKSHRAVSAEDLVESARKNIRILEGMGFYNIVISIKANDIFRTIESNKLFSREFDYPLHIGITEAGTLRQGTIKNSIALFDLLSSGIGDTIRVSLSCDPVDELAIAWDILNVLGIRKRGIELISCPTCGRKNIDVFSLAESIEKEFRHITRNIKIAVMGCPVNGIDESVHADIGICGNPKGEALIYYKGRRTTSATEDKIREKINYFIAKFINDI